MIKVFYFFVNKDKYYCSSPIINNIKMLFNNHNHFLKNNIELTPFLQFLPNYNNEMFQDISIDDFKNNVHLAMDNILLILPEIVNKYDKIIFFAFHPAPFQPFIRKYKIISSYPNVKTLLWQDDLQAYFPDRINKLDYADHIITPSPVYFKNIAPQFLDKSTFFFYSADFEENEKYCIPWENRKNQIILSGCTNSSYRIRYNIASLILHNNDFKEIGYLLRKPRKRHFEYDKNDVVPFGDNYYKTLALYKGAFFGYYEYPKNFNLAKIIEILSMGCIGFFEFSPLLEEELGLIAFKHYVPCTNNGELITEKKYYTYFLKNKNGEGLKIAKEGQKYIKDNFSTSNGINNYIKIFSKI